MIDPSEALQRTVLLALRNSLSLTEAFGATPRIYDRIPDKPVFPYLTIGEDQILDDGTSTFEATEAIVTVHVWSRGVGKTKVKQLAGGVRTALTMEIDVQDQTCIDFQFRDTRYLRDPDGLTEHAVITFRYLLQPTGD